MRPLLKHIRWMPILMTLTILGIIGFQLYWLKQAFEREERTLEIRTNMAFRETIHSLQATKLELDKIEPDSLSNIEKKSGKQLHKRMRSDEKLAGMMNILRDRMKESDSTGNAKKERATETDSIPQHIKPKDRRRIMQFLYDMDSLQDSITVKEIDSAFTNRLQQQSLVVPFSIARLPTASDREERVYNEVTLGFKNPVTYRLQISKTLPFLLQRISAPILLSVFLVAFAIVSFSLLYGTLLRQRRLAAIKNEFISNITHELKTPIATVSVAIEALRSFNASMDAQKTKEYLDISANELQRLSLLVDKVLKLSMFEKREVELKYEELDMALLVVEVTTSMKLQAEKYNAVVAVSVEGNTTFSGDRLHLVSVIFNLVDNALKYSNEAPHLNININGASNNIVFSIADKGIGVPAEYKDKIFEKFFRVPTGNLHNAKGYGLGLSYVAHVVAKHNGTINVECEGVGSKFIITLPRHEA